MLLLAVPSPGGAIVVVRDDEVVHESTDGGRTYHDMYRASGPVYFAAISADGTLYVLHDDELVVVRNGKTIANTRHARPRASSSTVATSRCSTKTRWR